MVSWTAYLLQTMTGWMDAMKKGFLLCLGMLLGLASGADAATRYAVASGAWSNTTTVWNDTESCTPGTPGSYVPVDGDSVVICSGVSIQMDADQSSFTGLLTVTIQGGSSPGMLYFKDGASGYLKIRTGYNLDGTLSTNRGRLLANSDGVWGNTGALGFSYKAIIDLQGTAKVLAANLDIALYATHPTNWFVRTYGTKKTVTGSATNDTLTATSHGWSDGTALSVRVSGGSLPSPLLTDRVYFVVNATTDTFKLAYTSGGSAIDLTTDGSGTIEAYSGHTNTSTATMNVLEDVTSDTPWTTTDGHDRVVLVDIGPEAADWQRTQLSAIASGSITLAENVDSAQNPGARIYLSSRNVSIRSNSTGTSQIIIDFSTNAYRTPCVFGGEIVNTAGTGSTVYGVGINGGYDVEVQGIFASCAQAVASSTNLSVSGVIAGCDYALNSGQNIVVSGTLAGCTWAITNCRSVTVSGNILGSSNGLYGGYEIILTGTLIGGSNAIYYTGPVTVFGTVYGFTSHFRSSGYVYVRFMSGASINKPLAFGDRNAQGYKHRIYFENYDGTLDDHRIFDSFGDIVKTACNGSGDAPSQDPSGGNGYAIGAVNLQSNLNADNKLRILDEFRVWLAAGTHTVTFKVQTTFAGISAGNLLLTANYLTTGTALGTQTNAPAISQRSSATDWSQTLSVTFTSAYDGWATFYIDLFEYEANNEVYIWPVPTIS
jgi:hypothetical protein